MGEWQKVQLKRKETVTTTSTSGTVTLNLPEKDYISQLLITTFHLNTTLTNDGLVPVAYTISKIEVLNGSEVIKSLSGRQVQALAYYWGRTNPFPHRIDWESTETYDFFNLRFGRFPHDTELMLNMAMLTNPQLKITYDFVTTSYYGKTYDCPTTPTFKWSVLADIYRGAPPAAVKGYIRSQQIFDYTQVATKKTYIKIPITEKIIGIMCQGGQTGKRLLQDFNRIRLNIDNAKKIPIDVYEEEFLSLTEEWFSPPPEVHSRFQAIGGKQIDSGLGICIAPQAQFKGGTGEEPRISGNVGGFITVEVRDPTVPDWDTSTDFSWFLAAKGLFPHHTIYIPAHALTKDGAFTLDAPSMASIVLELTSSSASTSAIPNVVLDTLGVY